jgi:phosphoglycolate phosphatase
MPIKLILFDLDGTLVDTIKDITQALNYALNSVNLRKITVEDTAKLVGEGLTRLIEKTLGDERMQLRDIVSRKFLEYYSEHLVDYSNEYPHVRETLEILGNYKKAVISNKREYLSTKLLEELDLLKFFELVIGSDTTTERKPSAVPVIYVLTKLKVKPEEALMVGDSNYDIEAAVRAGVRTVAVTYGYGAKQYLSGADYIIEGFSDLPAVLDIISSHLI